MFVAPSLILLGAFSIYPLCSSLWLSLQKRHLFSPVSVFVGLDNFAALLQDPEFWAALGNGLIFSVSTVVLQLLVGIATALLLNEAFRGARDQTVPELVLLILHQARGNLPAPLAFPTGGLPMLGTALSRRAARGPGHVGSRAAES